MFNQFRFRFHAEVYSDAVAPYNGIAGLLQLGILFTPLLRRHISDVTSDVFITPYCHKVVNSAVHAVAVAEYNTSIGWYFTILLLPQVSVFGNHSAMFWSLNIYDSLSYRFISIWFGVMRYATFDKPALAHFFLLLLMKQSHSSACLCLQVYCLC